MILWLAKKAKIHNTHRNEIAVGIVVLVILLSPLFSVYAQSSNPEVQAIYQKFIDNIINPIIYLLVGIATVVFLYGMVEFVAGADNDQKIAAGKRHIVWGLIGLFVALGVFGIIELICNTINCR